MKNRNRLCVFLVISTFCFFAGGCWEPVYKGVAIGVTDGLASLVESFITSTVGTAIDGM
ncbi:MAG: hypothetical protein WBE26_19735 [Phycisphaerae bacterium]